MNQRQRVHTPGWRGALNMTLGLVLASGVLVGCDSLLEVDLPDAVTPETLEDPSSAQGQLEGLQGLIECGLSSFHYQAAGYEDNYQRIAGAYGTYSEYNSAPGGGSCDTDDDNFAWFGSLSSGRAQAYGLYRRLEEDWADVEIANRDELMAQTALYAAVALDTFGEFFCEMAISNRVGTEDEYGPLMTRSETLDLAEDWVNTALDHIAVTGDFELVNGITGPDDDGAGIETFAHALRARIRWANGDGAGALADIAEVPEGFTAWISREQGVERRNKVYFHVSQPGGILLGPITEELWDDPEPGSPSYFDPSGWAGEGWPNPIPFTGYLDLALTVDGRAVDANGYPITLDEVGAVEDTRVQHEMGSVASGGSGEYPVARPPMVTSYADDQPLVSWRDLWLIAAEIEGQTDPQDAIDRVNVLRNFHGLPEVTGAYATLVLTDADELENMIIEERRRELWMQGRFWATKIQNPDKLWFPRDFGNWAISSLPLNGGVSLAMPGNEYDQNPNFGVEDRGTGCAPERAPVIQG